MEPDALPALSDRAQELAFSLWSEDLGRVPARLESVQPEGAARDGVRTALAKLRFTIHGRTHDVETPVKLTFTREHLLRIQGEVKLKMSDFEIYPAAKLGVIKVEDAVTVWWDLYAEPQRAQD